MWQLVEHYQQKETKNEIAQRSRLRLESSEPHREQMWHWTCYALQWSWAACILRNQCLSSQRCKDTLDLGSVCPRAPPSRQSKRLARPLTVGREGGIPGDNSVDVK